MCGLCGVHSPRGVGDDDHQLVRGMTDLLAHRGPDGDGVWRDGVAVLGHRRLAVIDPATSAQPMVSDDGRVALVYNGEVYNYRDLRRTLSAKGHRFRTSGDTEVVLRGYDEWGEGVVERLHGMFAFALRDGRRDRLVLARDRLGVKPLHYHEARDGRLLFASESKALLLDPSVPRAADPERVAEYLAFRALVDGGSLMRGLRVLPPATVAVREAAGPLRLRCYWTPDVASAPAAEWRDRTALVARGRGLVEDAIRARLVSDVPLGALVSGGLDSSLMAAVAAAAVKGPLDTFCAGFDDPQLDERPYARTVAARIGARHHEVVLTADAFEGELDRLTWANDEPLALSNAIPMHLVLRRAREAGVPVVLSGEGADEVFGGYSWYTLAHRRASVRRLPGARLLAGLAPPRGRLGRLRRLLDPDRLLSANAMTEPAIAEALAPQGGDAVAGRRHLAPTRPDDLFAYDQRTYLQPILHRQDRMGMAAGVEVREPFLHHPLVEWANALPVRAKLTRGVRKALLREVAAPQLPAHIVHREKVGFAMPTGEWLRTGGPLAERAHALRDPSAPVASLVDREGLHRALRAHERGDASSLVWALVALDTWGRVFLGERVRPARLPGGAGPTGTNQCCHR